MDEDDDDEDDEDDEDAIANMKHRKSVKRELPLAERLRAYSMFILYNHHRLMTR